MREDAAAQVGAQLLFDVTWQLVAPRARALHEGLQMLGENLVQRVLFWLVAAVSTRLGMSAGARHDVPGTASRGPSLATTPSAEDRRVSAREREWIQAT